MDDKIYVAVNDNVFVKEIKQETINEQRAIGRYINFCEKYGCPVPPARKMTLPLFIAATALSLENNSLTVPQANGVKISVFIPQQRQISDI